MTPGSTVWDLDSQTLGKHLVLTEYLKAWIPIVASRGETFLFVDGFAGPGRYSKGEEGSPVIAVRLLREHSALDRIKGPLRFVFIEADKRRFAALSTEVTDLRATLPGCAEIQIAHAEFASTLSSALDHVKALGRQAAPAFVMADPFGIDGAPMTLFARLLQQPATELYITVMASFIHRFAGTDEFAVPLDELYGTKQWRELLSLDLDKRREALLDLYEEQLRFAGARYVLRFDLYRGNSYVYSIFHATKNPLGCAKMKDAIWKVMPDGNFEYRDRDASQIPLGVAAPQFSVLEAQILKRIAGGEWIPMPTLDHWAQTDATMFRTAHVRTALKALESRGAIEADRSRGRQFSDKVLVRAL